jgi:hypothetical protein
MAARFLSGGVIGDYIGSPKGKPAALSAHSGGCQISTINKWLFQSKPSLPQG